MGLAGTWPRRWLAVEFFHGRRIAVVDVEKQVEHWRNGALEACRSVPVLAEKRFWPEALFWMHLSIEKAMKAHVARSTRAVPPPLHNLNRLAEIAGIVLDEQQASLCDSLNRWQMLSRYGMERKKTI